MINNYEIRTIHGEEVLYLYINNDYEFARINKGKKRKSFFNNIHDFLNKNNITFSGTTIAIVAGGLIIGNLFLQRSDDLNLKNSIMSIHINPQIVEPLVLDSEFQDKTSINNEISTIKEIPNTHNSENKKEISNKNEINNHETIKSSNNKDNIINDNKKDEKKDIITVFRDNGDIIKVELEEYLVNVVASEMPASFNIEALKAQSVLARTYAKKIISSGRILTDTTSTQRYKNTNELKNMWGNNYNKYYEKIKNAVQSTRDEVLKYEGVLIDAVYHSTSNGMTEDSENVWGNSFPYLKSVDSSFDKSVRNFKKTTFFSYSKISELLGFNVNNSTVFNIVSRYKSGRVMEILVDKNIFSGISFRKILSLRSSDFEIEQKEDGVYITTYGYGHGVGMSQYGANEMGKNGFSYKEILYHYYQGTTLSSL